MAGISKRERKNKKIGEAVSKMTPENIKKLEEAFAYDCSIDEACLYAGITPPTYYKWLKKNPKLVKRFEQLRNWPVLKARKAALTHLESSYASAMDYLSRKRKGEFSTKDGSSAPPSGSQQEITDEQAQRIARRILATDKKGKA